MMDTDRISRIREMEERMDRVGEWIRTVSSAQEQMPSIQADVSELSAYCDSGHWLKDYEADEAGELPADLKRGVLSEDGLYDLLSDYETLLQQLQHMCEE